MRIKSSQLIEGIHKAKGLVDEGTVIEQIRGFKFRPRIEEGKLDIAGSDSRMTLYATIDFVPSEESDSSDLSIPSDAIQRVINHIDSEDDFIFSYTKESEELNLAIGKFNLTIGKKDFENEFIDFDLLDTDDYTDEIDRLSFIRVLEGMISLAKADSFHTSYQTVYFDGEYAYLFDGQILGRTKFATKGKYSISLSVARNILVVLKKSEEETFKIKSVNQILTLLKTEKDLFTYKVYDNDFPDHTLIDEVEEDIVIELVKSELYNAINRTIIACEDDSLECVIEEDRLVLRGIKNSGEEAIDEVEITRTGANTEKLNVEIHFDNLLKLMQPSRTKKIRLAFDVDEYKLKVIGDEGKYEGVTSVNIG